MINGAVGAFETVIEFFSDLRTILRVEAHDAHCLHTLVLAFSVVAMIVEILILIDRIGIDDSGLVTFTMVSTRVVYHEAFKFESDFSAGYFVVL